MSQVKTYTTAEIRYGTKGGNFVALPDHERDVAALREELAQAEITRASWQNAYEVRGQEVQLLVSKNNALSARLALTMQTAIPAFCTHGAYDDDAACMDCLKAWGRYPFNAPAAEQGLYSADKWETLYRNEHAASTRLLDTMTGLRKQRDDLQKRLTGPVAIAMPDLETEFPTWWEDHGQFVRAGGGDYERSFAYRAYEGALAKVADMNTTAGPDEVQP
jgi:hypothetical protein